MPPAAAEAAVVVLVEDDPSIGHSVEDSLRASGFTVRWYRTGLSALDGIDAAAPDLVLLDAVLPDIDGFTLCRWLREQHPALPILIVTARHHDIDVVVGLDAGANDYVTKPFSMKVLLARVRAQLRVISTATPEGLITVGVLTIDPRGYTASVDSVVVDLRPRELELLAYLARHAGAIVGRDELLAEVWDMHWATSTRTVEMHIVALRRKLGPVVTISTIRGIGYRLDAS